MGYKALLFILIISLLSISCSAINYSNQPNNSERDYSTFNRLGAKHSSKIILLDDEIFATNFVRAEGDSLHYYFSSDTLSVPLSSVEKVIIKKWAVGIVSGLVAGTVVMLASSYVLSRSLDGDMGVAILAQGSSLLLGLSALIFGIFYGDNSEYIFNKKNHEQIEYYKEYHKRKDSLNSNVNSNINNMP